MNMIYYLYLTEFLQNCKTNSHEVPRFRLFITQVLNYLFREI